MYEHTTISKHLLSIISKIGHKIQTEIDFVFLIVSQKQFIAILNSLAHIKCINFRNVLFDFSIIHKVNANTRFTISAIRFYYWTGNWSFDFILKIFKILSSNKSLCESLELIEIHGPKSRYKLEDGYHDIEEQLQKMGYSKLTVKTNLYGL